MSIKILMNVDDNTIKNIILKNKLPINFYSHPNIV
ncbi:Lipoprotein, putative (fragment) [Mycoplasma leachii 99/014/6]